MDHFLRGLLRGIDTETEPERRLRLLGYINDKTKLARELTEGHPELTHRFEDDGCGGQALIVTAPAGEFCVSASVDSISVSRIPAPGWHPQIYGVRSVVAARDMILGW